MSIDISYRCYIEREIHWRWKIKFSNGRIVCASPRSFETRAEALQDLKKFIERVTEGYNKEARQENPV